MTVNTLANTISINTTYVTSITNPIYTTVYCIRRIW